MGQKIFAIVAFSITIDAWANLPLSQSDYLGSRPFRNALKRLESLYNQPVELQWLEKLPKKHKPNRKLAITFQIIKAPSSIRVSFGSHTKLTFEDRSQLLKVLRRSVAQGGIQFGLWSALDHIDNSLSKYYQSSHPTHPWEFRSSIPYKFIANFALFLALVATIYIIIKWSKTLASITG